MVPSLTSIRNAWATTTTYDSLWLKLLVVAAAAAFGWVITWELSEAWEQMFGYSSAMTIFTTYIVFFTLYFCFSYVVTRTLR